MNETMKKAIEYVKSQIDKDELENAVSKSMYRKEPLHIVAPDVYDMVYDLLEEYGEDNGLPENWWCNETDDIEEIAGLALED